MKELERRVVRLESCLDSCRGPETLEEMFAALQRGDYGHFNLASVVTSILAHGRSVDHLRGELPDELIEFFAECLKKPLAERMPEEPDSL